MIIKYDFISKKDKIYLISFIFGILIFFVLLLINVFLYPNFGSEINFKSGIYKEPIEIEITNIIPHSEIRFTLDGSKPNFNSNIYSEKIKISGNSIIRFSNFRNNKPIGKEKIVSYIFLKNEKKLPILNLVVDDSYLFDSNYGIYHNNNFDKRGDRWKRPASLIYYKNGSYFQVPEFQRDVSIRIYGDKSREFPRKSFNICFNETLNYKIFEDSEISSFDCLTLRNSGNDWNSTLFKDAFVHKIVSETSEIHTLNYRPAILYINEKYYGIYNIREYLHNNLLAAKYGGDSKDYAILFPERSKGGKVSIESGNKNDAKLYYEIFDDAYKVINSIPNSSMNTNLDKLDFIDYHIFQTYIENFDFIGSNFKLYRYNGLVKYLNSPRDGKFRLLLYDTDASFGSSIKNQDIFNTLFGLNLSSKRSWPLNIYKGFISFDENKKLFINRYTYLINTTFKPTTFNSKIDIFAKRIEEEIPDHIDRWKNHPHFDEEKNITIQPLQSIEDWQNEVLKMKDFNNKRYAEVFEELNSSFMLGGVIEIEVENKNPQGGYVKVNQIDVKDSTWKGKFFKSQHVDVVPVAYEGFEVYNFVQNKYNFNSVDFRKKD